LLTYRRVGQQKLRALPGTVSGMAHLDAVPEQVASDAQLVVSELTTNAVVHAGSAPTVMASFDDGWLRIESTITTRRRHSWAAGPARAVSDDSPTDLAASMNSTSIRFAASSDPNGGELPVWSRYDTRTRALIDFGATRTLARGRSRSLARPVALATGRW
jgi:hypothetical protein